MLIKWRGSARNERRQTLRPLGAEAKERMRRLAPRPRDQLLRLSTRLSNLRRWTRSHWRPRWTIGFAEVGGSIRFSSRWGIHREDRQWRSCSLPGCRSKEWLQSP